ncbi:F0F1 ATP synthase subunit delta [Pedosphaera parvula]|uniref:H+transporting two-sector ATPase delta (OSCP) subunit n=1 Tax=Pedosphaera parvula (strain Ellin514) TaxID=320771 RepID=B9XPF0_PEDPL|nr:F0F1 ATP synthase subunit delta [Pedosphaera parvula]EEF58290.1 H+transporting two-sector ATPase delta (OSCP) subunit [Pedosphaera parvula Ellin514]
MKISKQDRREAKQLFRSCVANGVLDENRVRQAVSAVLAQKPRGYFAILSQFQKLVKLDLDRRAAKVESATALTPEMQASVKNNLTSKYGQGLNITFAQNPALLGGLRIQVGSDVYDGSVRARLQSLEESL